MENLFHTVISWIVIIFGLLIGLIALILVLIVLYKIIQFVYALFRSIFLKMTAGIRKRRVILKSLNNSEKNDYPHTYSLYEQHLHLAAGIKNVDEHKLRLDKYQKRMMVEFAKTSSAPALEESKVSYLEKNSAAIAKATAKAKAHGYDGLDASSTVYIFGDLDFDLPDFDFPDFGDFDLNF